MKRVATKLSFAALPLLALSLAGPASAQATRTWVSGVGDDANPCSRTAPCKTFQGAIAKTAGGGEISVLDPGGFGSVTITKSIAISGEWAGEAGVLVAATNGIIINAGATDVVQLRGLVIEGLGQTGVSGTNGINIFSAGEVRLREMVIRGFRDSGSGFGINVNPGTNDVKVSITDSMIANNGSAASGAGILVRPTGAAKAWVTVRDCELVGNAIGLKADGAGGTGAIKTQIVRTSVNGSVGPGIFAQSASGGPVNLFVDDTMSANNGSVGARVDGANATLTLNNSTFTANGGPGMQTINGGVLNSYRNNRSIGNGVADSPTVQVSFQ